MLGNFGQSGLTLIVEEVSIARVNHPREIQSLWNIVKPLA
jgi:hypothetical protein